MQFLGHGRRCPLASRGRGPGAGRDGADACHRDQLAFQSDRLDRDPRRPRGHSRIRPHTKPMDHCRRDLWPFRLRRAGLAPSFHHIMRSDDRVLFVQTLSKNWAMTGWRVGWLEAPPELGGRIESLVQYSTTGVPVPTQCAAVAAITGGETFIETQLARARANRDLSIGGTDPDRARPSIETGRRLLPVLPVRRRVGQPQSRFPSSSTKPG